MVTVLDYAVLSAAAYNNVRGPKSQIQENLLGWERIDFVPDGGIQGFSASAYKKGSDVVIAYKGTDVSFNSASDVGNTISDLLADLATGAGLGSNQLIQAALFYQKVKAANSGTNITFAGHSLGGGLASVMSVWFNRHAATFDEAPFELSAINPLVMGEVQDYLTSLHYADTEFDNLMKSPAIFTARESQVDHTFVKGEFLDAIRTSLTAIYGINTPLGVGGGDALGASGGVTLHSMNLAASLLMQDKLRTDTEKLTNLLPAIFDENLYMKDLTKDRKDFLTGLLNDQIKQGYTSSTGLLAQFATDVEKLAQSGGLTMASNDLNKALIVAAIEAYYFKQSGDTKAFFETIAGGLHFDLKDIGADWGASDMKAYNALLGAARQLFGSPLGGSLLAANKPSQWYVQAGAAYLQATAASSDNSVMLGGRGADTYVYSKGDGADTYVYSLPPARTTKRPACLHGKPFSRHRKNKAQFQKSEIRALR